MLCCGVLWCLNLKLQPIKWRRGNGSLETGHLCHTSFKIYKQDLQKKKRPLKPVHTMKKDIHLQSILIFVHSFMPGCDPVLTCSILPSQFNPELAGKGGSAVPLFDKTSQPIIKA